MTPSRQYSHTATSYLYTGPIIIAFRNTGEIGASILPATPYTGPSNKLGNVAPRSDHSGKQSDAKSRGHPTPDCLILEGVFHGTHSHSKSRKLVRQVRLVVLGWYYFWVYDGMV